MRTSIIAIALATGLVVPSIATAQQDRNRYGHDAIEAGDYAEAEAMLRADLAIDPDLPEALINLAAIYGRTGRVDAAKALYARVLRVDDMSMLVTPEKALSSHRIAQVGLNRLDAMQTAAR